MPREDELICTRGKIWELHIHSNQCFSADKELKKLSIPEYVTAILAVLEDYRDLEMISFTDHNQICLDLYKEFINRKSRLTLLPGIEIDTSLVPNGEKKDSKHIVVYFDAVDNLDRLEMIAREVNRFMISENIGVQDGQHGVGAGLDGLHGALEIGGHHDLVEHHRRLGHGAQHLTCLCRSE